MKIHRIVNKTKVQDVKAEKNELNDNIILWEGNILKLSCRF